MTTTTAPTMKKFLTAQLKELHKQAKPHRTALARIEQKILKTSGLAKIAGLTTLARADGISVRPRQLLRGKREFSDLLRGGVLSILADEPGGLKKAKIHERLNTLTKTERSNEAMQQLLARMLEAGMIKRMGRGVWALKKRARKAA